MHPQFSLQIKAEFNRNHASDNHCRRCCSIHAIRRCASYLDAIGRAGGGLSKTRSPVADIVSPIWHDEEERDDEPGQLVRLLGIKSGMTVADIGAGSGYYVVRLSPIVGPTGKVFAEDVMPEYVRMLRNRVRDIGLQNVAIGPR